MFIHFSGGPSVTTPTTRHQAQSNMTRPILPVHLSLEDYANQYSTHYNRAVEHKKRAMKAMKQKRVTTLEGWSAIKAVFEPLQRNAAVYSQQLAEGVVKNRPHPRCEPGFPGLGYAQN